MPIQRGLELTALISLLLLLLSGCSGESPAPPVPPAPTDHYAPSAMTFGAPPAVLSNERHTGAFSTGAALSPTAAVKALDPSPVKEIHLDTTHKVIELAPGVKFAAWTFGDQVPGPVIRARVGDRIKFSMTNRSDEAVPGVRLTSAPMMHSMDFHAAMVAPNDNIVRSHPGRRSASSSRRTTPASSCITAEPRWCSNTSPPGCTAW